MSQASSEPEILRHHTFYQTSFIGPRPARTNRTVLVSPRKRIVTNRKQKQKKRNTDESKSRKSVQNTTPRNVFETVTEALDYRRTSRSNRVRPWREENPSPSRVKSNKIQLFYEGNLPSHFDPASLNAKSRKYVSNTKYGKLYEIRQPTNSPRVSSPRTPPTSTYVWEDDFVLWLNGSRDKYIEDLSSRSKNVVVTGKSSNSTSNSTPRSTPSSESQKPSPSSLPSIKQKVGRPSAAVYAYYNSHRLEKSRRKSSAVLVQKVFRGWYVRHFIKKLKRKALLEHGKTFPKFVKAYKEIVARIQCRYGFTKTYCSFDLRQLNTFMDNKLKYEAAFKKLSFDDKLNKEDLVHFFNLCELWPTKGEINRSFDKVFKGSGNTAEVIFLLDCSTCIDIIGFYNVIQFLKDIVLGLDIAPDRVRVGVIPYNEDVFSAFGISAFTNKSDILDAISKIKIRLGMTRTDVALRHMLQMFKDSRPHVQNIGVVITDGKSSYPDKTEHEAKQAHIAGVKMFVIGVGTKADEKEMHTIASSPKHIFTAVNPRSLSSIRTRLETRFCLAACSFCRYLLPRLARFGLLISEVLDIMWTTYPPDAANIGVEKYLRIKPMASPKSKPTILPHKSYFCRPISLEEGLELVWTCYPPEACGLSYLRFSRWIRPIVAGKEAWTLLDDNILKATNIKTCLRLVIQSKLERQGYIAVPSNVREGIERTTSEEEALQIVQEFIEKSRIKSEELEGDGV